MPLRDGSSSLKPRDVKNSSTSSPSGVRARPWCGEVDVRTFAAVLAAVIGREELRLIEIELLPLIRPPESACSCVAWRPPPLATVFVTVSPFTPSPSNTLTTTRAMASTAVSGDPLLRPPHPSSAGPSRARLPLRRACGLGVTAAVGLAAAVAAGPPGVARSPVAVGVVVRILSSAGAPVVDGGGVPVPMGCALMRKPGVPLMTVPLAVRCGPRSRAILRPSYRGIGRTSSGRGRHRWRTA